MNSGRVSEDLSELGECIDDLLTEDDVNYQKGKLPCFVVNFWVEVQALLSARHID